MGETGANTLAQDRILKRAENREKKGGPLDILALSILTVADNEHDRANPHRGSSLPELELKVQGKLNLPGTGSLNRICKRGEGGCSCAEPGVDLSDISAIQQIERIGHQI
jgi:hypothetical protein